MPSNLVLLVIILAPIIPSYLLFKPVGKQTFPARVVIGLRAGVHFIVSLDIPRCSSSAFSSACSIMAENVPFFRLPPCLPPGVHYLGFLACVSLGIVGEEVAALPFARHASRGSRGD